MSTTIYRSTSDTSMILRALEERTDVLAAQVEALVKDVQMLIEWMRYSNAHRRINAAQAPHRGN